MTDFLYTDARWTKHFVEVSDPHKQGHHVRFYFERPWIGLTDEEIEKGRDQKFSINNPYCPCDSQTMRTAVRWAEAQLKNKNTGEKE